MRTKREREREREKERTEKSGKKRIARSLAPDERIER